MAAPAGSVATTAPVIIKRRRDATVKQGIVKDGWTVLDSGVAMV